MIAVNNFMRSAVEQALCGMIEGGHPVGAVLVKDGQIVGKGHNHVIANNDPTAHAEMEAIRNAGRIDFAGTTLYSTVMPCPMCAAAIAYLGIPHVVAGDSRSMLHGKDILLREGVAVEDLDLDVCRNLAYQTI
ncbi:MAG: nucleoside deaminase [Phycisphaerae bacterium]